MGDRRVFAWSRSVMPIVATTGVLVSLLASFHTEPILWNRLSRSRAR